MIASARSSLTSSETNVVLRGLTCIHPRMNYCCKTRCGHLSCPDCHLFGDEGAEGGETPMYLRQRPMDAGELLK